MPISSIRDFVTSSANYFFESSWKGKTVQVLGVLSVLTLLYYVFLKKAPPKGPNTTSNPLFGRVENNSSVEITANGSNVASTVSSTRAQAQPQTVLPKADCSYIQKTQIDPDFKFPKSEFETWLSDKMTALPCWSAWAGGDQARKVDLCRTSFNQCLLELKNYVKIMIPIFEDRCVKQPDGGVFLNDCTEAVVDNETNLIGFCEKLKGYLDRLQTWNTDLYRMQEAQWKDKLKYIHFYHHYEFTNLQTQYFHYLGLHKIDDFSRLLDAKIASLEQFGLRTMEDIDCLQLRAMQPSIERLRQFVCFFEITGDKEAVRPLIEKEIKQCREVLEVSEKISNKLYGNYGQELEETVKNLRESFDKLASNFDNGLGLLHQIEQNDIVRQRILLKGYINQSGLVAKWKQLNAEKVVNLAACAKDYKIDTLSQFYKMSAVERRT